MNRDSQTGGKKKTLKHSKKERLSVILSSLVAFNFPFPTVKMSEMNRQLQ